MPTHCFRNMASEKNTQEVIGHVEIINEYVDRAAEVANWIQYCDANNSSGSGLYVVDGANFHCAHGEALDAEIFGLLGVATEIFAHRLSTAVEAAAPPSH